MSPDRNPSQWKIIKMKQVLQRLDSGLTELIDVPVPGVSGHYLLVETKATLVSAGTERMLVEFGRSNLIQKARSQPDKVIQLVDKIRTDGLSPTVQAVRAKLGEPIPLGYCQAGIVVSAGANVKSCDVGSRVVTNGPHAEYVRVPQTLAARIPDNVSFEAAAFAPVAAIALQGIRIAAPTLGETVVVIGLGLIGLLAVQLLRANGCRVIGIDQDHTRLSLAESFGATAIDSEASDVVMRVEALTGGVGADAVLLTLASKSDEPIHQAAAMSRKRGRLVLVGVTGLNLVRDDFFKKELSFSVSCSYGPGRYDPTYEEQGRDYPLPYVRWTEQRNFEAVLELMKSATINPLPLITHRFAIAEVADAYEVIAGKERSLGVVLTYPDHGGVAPDLSYRTIQNPSRPILNATTPSIGVIGAGNYATRTLLPILSKMGVRLHTIASSTGTSGAIAAKAFGFENVTTDAQSVYTNSEIDSIIILTRHDSHAELTRLALEAGKHVFVEKPLALHESELEIIRATAVEQRALLMVGFNRRFAPLTREAQKHLRGRAGPATIVATINAGAIPADHWTQDAMVGGGRIVGEACHWIDLTRALIGSAITDVQVMAAHDAVGGSIDDIAHIMVRFADGSTAAVHYLANGSRKFPKERIECFFDGKTIVIDNWRRLRRFGVKTRRLQLAGTMDKGHRAALEAWKAAVTGQAEEPIPLDEILEVSRWSIRAADAARAACHS
jgi:predicted dehydrogenase/threonine dehydrogenase-like Zn-dependent dehydrogenase